MKSQFISILKPKEFSALLQLKFSKKYAKVYPENLDDLAEQLFDVDFCYASLEKVSRSFAVVIQQLPTELKDSVCIFYLVLRGLDSIEDDMQVPKADKLDLLQNFYLYLEDRNWNIKNIGDSEDYKILLENFDKIIRSYQSLDKKYQAVIADICRKMGNGMADFYETKINTKKEYNLYCHHVAGLVGHGLSKLFSVSGLESPTLQYEFELSNDMGLMLQKTNITRDYFEDIVQDRIFWPTEIWQKHTKKLTDFSKNPTQQNSINALNAMVTDALQHFPNSIYYLKNLRNRQIFRFCAIPQLMAIATLATIYNNPKVFTENVKIRKGISAKIMVYINSYDDIFSFIETSVNEIQKKINYNDSDYAAITQVLINIKKAIQEQPIHQPTLVFRNIA